jgi:hypothetical protein
MLIKVLVFAVGVIITVAALTSTIRTLVMSRAARDPVTGLVFVLLRKLFNFRLRWARSYEDRDAVMVYYAPISLLTLPPVWLALVLIGFMCMFWASGIPSWNEAFQISGSSLLTLGFAKGDTFLQTILAFAEATIGLILVALLIAYLPTMYNAFSRRETAVSLLEVRAGSPPSPVEMILRYNRNQGLDALHESWMAWETWFAELEESHTSLAALVFFRSPQSKHSWVTAAGTVLDAAALTLATVDVPWDAQAALCVRAGYLALHRIADYFSIEYERNAHFPEDPISITREEFNAICDQFAAAGVPMKQDRQQAWQDFGGWRVNYDTVLLAISKLVMAPPGAWSTNREEQASVKDEA